MRGASEEVLDGIARALQLDEGDRMHLFDLVRAVNTSSARRRSRRQPQEHVRPVVHHILDSFVGVPAFVQNARTDVLAANLLGRAFYAPQYDDPARPVNGARFVFLSPRAKEFFLDWETIARDVVGILRVEAGRDPYDKRLSDLIGELSTRSDDFRVRWAAHDVKLHRTGVKRFNHPVVGELTLDFETLDLPVTPASGCSSTAPRPGRRHGSGSTSSPAGQPHPLEPRRPSRVPSHRLSVTRGTEHDRDA